MKEKKFSIVGSLCRVWDTRTVRGTNRVGDPKLCHHSFSLVHLVCIAQSPDVCMYVCMYVNLYLQLFRERLLEKVHATISKSILGGFEFTVLQRNLREWHEWAWTYVCEC